MSYILKGKTKQVKVGEIAYGDYFEFDGNVYQKVRIAPSLAVASGDKGPAPVFAVNLTINVATYFSRDGDCLVTPLHEESPLILHRAQK